MRFLQMLPIVAISGGLLACSLSDGGSDDGASDDTVATPGVDEDGVPVPPVLTVATYRDFLEVALKTRPVVTFDGFPIGKFPTYSSGPDSVDDDGETTIIQHLCEGGVGTGLTTQFRQAAEEGEAEPVYGTEGDFDRSQFTTCLRDGFEHDGSIEDALKTHAEFEALNNPSAHETIRVSNSVEEMIYTSHMVTKKSTGEYVSLNGLLTRTTHRDSERDFNTPSERDIVVYIDEVSTSGLVVKTHFIDRENIEHSYRDYSQIETDETLQWSGDVNTIIDKVSYTYRIDMPQAMEKSEGNGYFDAGELSIGLDTATLNAIFFPNGRVDVTVDENNDGEFELETRITLWASTPENNVATESPAEE